MDGWLAVSGSKAGQTASTWPELRMPVPDQTPN